MSHGISAHMRIQCSIYANDGVKSTIVMIKLIQHGPQLNHN